ncbi:MAG: glycosyltransferase [Pseudomonadota bacterium]
MSAADDLPAELAALRSRFHPDVLHWALRRARQVGVGGDEVLLQAGLVTADELARAHADHLGLPLALLPGRHVAGARLHISSQRAATALRAGVVPQRSAQGLGFILAPRGKSIRKLANDLALEPRADLSLAAPERLRGAIAAWARQALAWQASEQLRHAMPHLSAANIPRGRTLGAVLAFAATALLALGVVAPAELGLCAVVTLSLLFLCVMGLRLAGCLVPEAAQMPARIADRDLPVYSVLVPLYREAAVVPRLVSALRELDYPPEKLDIKLVVEPDDVDTQRALAAQALSPSFEVLVAPASGPRTKPKALNAALPFARGRFVAIFDAEDRPEPGQLRAALEAFRRGGARLACVQARLVVDNPLDSWVSRHFAVEYCAQFDVLVPALAAMRLPILLGGTSNHFRRAALEQAGAWDAYNVTEDADLGLRLIRAGWEVDVIAADTLEEAPVRIGAWLRQRTRWMKGWAQTILVHGRNPAALVRQIGPARAFAALLLTVGPFAAMAIHPISLVNVIWHFAQGGRDGPSAAEALALALSYANLLIGYAATLLVSLVGLRRRKRLGEAWILLTLPLYWILQSVAVWRALIDLVRDPYRWDKTEHGLAQRPATQQVTEAASNPPLPQPAAAWR